MSGTSTETFTEPELEKSALITIDTQCDFSLPGAPVEIQGTYGIIPKMKRLLDAYRQVELPIIHIVRLYKPDGSNVDLCRRKTVLRGVSIVRPETPGAELVEDLKPEPGVKLDMVRLLKGKIQKWGKREFVIYKPRWGAFYKTPLNDFLKGMGISTLIFCGCNFPNCPRTTIYEASERDYRVALIEDAISGLYDRGRKELRNIGVYAWRTTAFIEMVMARA